MESLKGYYGKSLSALDLRRGTGDTSETVEKLVELKTHFNIGARRRWSVGDEGTFFLPLNA